MNAEKPVREIMTREVITVSPEDTMDKVRDIFRRHAIHHLPILRDGRVVGILSKSDYLRLQHGFTLFKTHKSEEYNDAIMRSLLVGEVMVKQVATLNPEDTIEIALGIFRENLFHALPVVDQSGQLVGIVTTYDLLNYAYLGEAAFDEE
ncbi:MAG: CBS domain-containing protein [Saprospiraceae bacterium]|nr:CBS domain-containing protein [Saprospiraceae bacterium]